MSCKKFTGTGIYILYKGSMYCENKLNQMKIKMIDFKNKTINEHEHL